jgi:hypothetical protein
VYQLTNPDVPVGLKEVDGIAERVGTHVGFLFDGVLVIEGQYVGIDVVGAEDIVGITVGIIVGERVVCAITCTGKKAPKSTNNIIFLLFFSVIFTAMFSQISRNLLSITNIDTTQFIVYFY